MQKFEYTVLDMIEQASRVAKTAPINLGGVGGAGGGVGVPPGGFVGKLPQWAVAYDTLEAATLDTLPSGVTGSSGWSLVDNLNHIRYRLDIIESGGVGGAIIVEDWDGVPSIDPTSRIVFSGATVIDLGGGTALVVVGSGGSISATPFAIVSSNYVETTVLDSQNSLLILDTAVYNDDGLVSLATDEVSVLVDGWYDVDVTVAVVVNSGVATVGDGSIGLLINNTGYFDNTYAYYGITPGSLLNAKEFSTRGSVYLTTAGAGNKLSVRIYNSTGHSINAYVHELTVRPLASVGGGSGSSTFLDLTDTPNSYAGQAGKVVVVASGETGLEFITYSGGGTNNYYGVREYTDQSAGTSDTYGVLGGLVNGSNTLFTVSQGVYLTGTLRVYKNGQLQTQGTGEDWVETSPAAGTFTFATAPFSTDLITATYFTSQATAASVLTVEESDGSPSVTNVDTIKFSGAVVTNLGGGEVLVTISGSTSTPYSLTVEEQDGSPVVTSVDRMIFSGATVTDLGSGDALISITPAGAYSLTVQESDGSPIVINVDNILFSGATVTDLGSGDALISITPTSSYSLVVEEIDGSPVVTSVDRLIFSGATVTDLGSGDALISITTSTSYSLIVEEADGSPSVSNVDKIIFSGAIVTDLGSGDVLVTISGGGGIVAGTTDVLMVQVFS